MTLRTGPNKGEPLAKVAEHRKPALALLGRERAMIYKTLVLTGLRADELRTLECRDLSFGDVPFVKLRHSNEKSRKGSTVPPAGRTLPPSCESASRAANQATGCSMSRPVSCGSWIAI